MTTPIPSEPISSEESWDSAPEVVLFERESVAASARLSPGQVAEMRAEAELIAEADVEVCG